MAESPLKHIRREVPPWEPKDRTVCSRSAADVVDIVTEAEARALVKKHGKQRAAFMLCMTCAGNFTPTFADNPVECVRDWASRLRRTGWPRDAQEAERETREAHLLRCLAALVEAHRTEFDEMLTTGDDLAERRKQRRVAR